MGNIWGKLGKTKEEIKNDIIKINEITNNELFFRKTNYLLTFDLNENFFKNLFSNYVIDCRIVIENFIF